jgi:hypothetical protein
VKDTLLMKLGMLVVWTAVIAVATVLFCRTECCRNQPCCPCDSSCCPGGAK